MLVDIQKDSIVGVVTKNTEWKPEELQFDSRKGQYITVLSPATRPDLVTNQQLIQIYNNEEVVVS
jgi:hypothetical protein